MEKTPEKKSKNILDNNRFVQVLSVAIAILSWVFISEFFIQSTDKQVRGVSINYSHNAYVYQNKGLVMVGDVPQTLNITVEGSSSDISNAGKKDFFSYVDYSGVKEPGTYELEVFVESLASAGNVDIRNNSASVKTIMVDFEIKATESFMVEAETPGIIAEEGFVKSAAAVTPSLIDISGPANEVEKIAKLVAKISDRQVLSETKTFNSVPLAVFDREGNELSQDNLTLSSTRVEIKISIFEVRTLPLTVDFTGVPTYFELGWLEERMVLSQTTIDVAAEPAVFNNIKEVEIGKIDLSTFKLEGEDAGSYIFPVVLHKDLSNHEKLKEVEISFDISGMGQRSFSVANIRVVNVPGGLDIDAVDTKINNVVLVGEQAQLGSVLPENIVIEIDAFGVSATHSGRQILAARVIVASRGRVFAIGSYEIICNVTV